MLVTVTAMEKHGSKKTHYGTLAVVMAMSTTRTDDKFHFKTFDMSGICTV